MISDKIGIFVMSGQLRLILIGLVLVLTSFILEITPAGAAWVRLSYTPILVNITRICPDGVDIIIANSSKDNPPFGLPFAPEIIYFYRGSLDRNAIEVQYQFPPLDRRLFTKQVKLEHHPDDRLVGLPLDTSLPNEDYGFFTEAEWYVKSSFTWEGNTVLPGDTIGLINLHFDFVGEAAAEHMSFAGNYVVSDCSIEAPLSDFRPNFSDTRIDAYHPWQSAAVYCQDNMVKVYGINAEGNGYFGFAVTQADIDAVGIPEANTLLASAPSAFGGDIQLYKLKGTGELQINAPGLPPDTWKEYVFTWAGCT